jgi:transcriptional regulator with XRE-family HTH domain
VTKSIFSAKYETFRRELIAAREAAGLTQTQLATKLSRPQSFVSKYERGERRLDVIEFVEVAEALGIDPVRFIGKVLRSPASRKRSS